MRKRMGRWIGGLALTALAAAAVTLPSCTHKEGEGDKAAKTQPTTKSASTGGSGNLVELKIELPRPLFEGTPKNIKEKMRPPNPSRKIMVPKGLDIKNLAAGKKVTSSDEEPIIGELSYVTDGDKEGTDGSFVELGPSKQWVQIDLGQPCDVYVVVMWHYHREGRVYRDVVVQAADDADFITNVRTIYNNDHDNSSGLGIGKDWQWLDDFRGEAVLQRTAKPVRARYWRFYSNGNTSNDLNHYTEIEIFGVPAKGTKTK